MLRRPLASATRLRVSLGPSLCRVRALNVSGIRCLAASSSGPNAALGPAGAVNAALHAAEANLTLRDHLIRIGLWALVSLNVGIYFSQGDEGAQILEHLDQFAPVILDEGAESAALEKALERVSRGLAQNDTLKMRLLTTPGLFDRLTRIIDSADIPTVTRNHAVKALEAMSSSAETQLEMVANGLHEPLIKMMGRDGSSLYVRKTLAAAICNLAQLPENAPALVRCGALGALVAEQAYDERLVRQRVQVSLGRLALAAHALDAETSAGLPPAELELIASLADAEHRAAAASPLHGVKATLIESGVLLYLHTAGGGAAWGLFESLRLSQPRSMLLQNVARTALVTCFVPILFVGGVVTGYSRVNKSTDSIREKFALYFSACLGLYPASRLLTWVEKFAPLWLGGHIVGFGSFFAWTLYTESDLLKSDAALLAPPEKKKKLVVLWPPPKPNGTEGAKPPPPAVAGPLPKPS